MPLPHAIEYTLPRQQRIEEQILRWKRIGEGMDLPGPVVARHQCYASLSRQGVAALWQNTCGDRARRAASDP
jgi:hypothetical protein